MTGKALSPEAFHKLHDYLKGCSICDAPLTEREVRDWMILSDISPSVTLTAHDWHRINLICKAWLADAQSSIPPSNRRSKE